VGKNDLELLRQVPQIVAEEISCKSMILSSLCKTPDIAVLLEWLEKLASVFSAPLPEEDGLLLYAEALDGYGEIGLREGIKQIIKRHRWPRLPFPAELIEYTQGPDSVAKIWRDQVHSAANKLPH